MSEHILGESIAIDMALQKAAEATQAYLDAHPDHWYPCGFAWVNIKPARGPLAKVLKERQLSSPGVYGGLQVYNPSGNHTQCMDAKEAGARAFVDFLKPLYPAYKISVGTRID
jgi:hypothetical protein